MTAQTEEILNYILNFCTSYTLYIILGLAFILILLILLTNIKLKIEYDGELTAKLKVMFLTFDLTSEKKAPKKKKIKAKKLQQEAEPPQEKKKQVNVIKSVKEIAEIITAAIEPLGKIVKHCKVDDFYADIMVHEDDAAETGVKYGQTNLAVYTMLALMRNAFKVNVKRLKITCDFKDPTNTYQIIRFTIKIKIIFVILAFFAFLIKLIGKKQKEGATDERTSNN